jgi:hypothetical protein
MNECDFAIFNVCKWLTQSRKDAKNSPLKGVKFFKPLRMYNKYINSFVLSFLCALASLREICFFAQ